ncbi:MAG: hypothetical protein NVSMB30_05470 [Hymenobacter sp.]
MQPQTLTNLVPELFEELFERFLAENKQPIFYFRTLDANANTMAIQSAEGVTNAIVNASRTIPGAARVRTPDGKMHRLLYSEKERVETVNGQTVVIQEPEPITFEPKEFCIRAVARNQRELLIRLLFSNECRNGLNPALEESPRGFVYELIQPAKTAEAAIVNDDAILDAKLAVRAAGDTELQLGCERLQLPFTADRNVNIKTRYTAAERDPQAVFRVLSDEWDKTTGLVRDLTAAGLIAFDEAGRRFVSGADRKPLLEVPSGAPEAALVSYLNDSQGKRVKVNLARQLAELGSKKKK